MNQHSEEEATRESTMDIDNENPAEQSVTPPSQQQVLSAPPDPRQTINNAWMHTAPTVGNGIGVGLEQARMMTSQPQPTTALVGAANNGARNEAVVQQCALESFGCPNIALLDSEFATDFSGDFSGCHYDRRVRNVSSWQSDYDADDYDKENQCRENIDNNHSEDGIYGLPHNDTELGLYPSPAFSEDSLYNTGSYVQSY